MEAQPALIIVIPLYRHPDLVEALCSHLEGLAGEIAEAGGQVLFINDSPDDPGLRATLAAARERLAARLPVDVLVNSGNLGFVRSANRGLAIARDRGADALLLNSDVEMGPGAVRELRRVSRLDPMIGFVCPRSNRATLCSLPTEAEAPPGDPGFDEARRRWERLQACLPDWQWAPTGVGFCMLVRNLVLRELGMLDEAYGRGYNEENDLCMRANRAGFRVALANRAFAYHQGSATFGEAGRAELERRNRSRLLARYPEYARAAQEYFDSPEHLFERHVSRALRDEKGRLEVVFDFSGFQRLSNGTTECAKSILKSLAPRSREVALSVVCDPRAAAYHRLSEIAPGATILPLDADRRFDVAFRIGQPFSASELSRMARLGAANVYMILDTIAWDCLSLRGGDLDALWRVMAETADGFLFNSEFTRGMFLRRFPEAAKAPNAACPHSLAAADYAEWAAPPAGREAPVLLVGNSYAHKNLRPTLDRLLAAFPYRRFRVFGLAGRLRDPRVETFPAGHLSEKGLRSVYAGASVIVFPSMYEGFGFPLVHGLAAGKTVFARDTALNRELIARWNGPGAWVPYRDSDHLVEALRAVLERGSPGDGLGGRATGDPWDWAAGARLLVDFLGRVSEADPQLRRCLARLGRIRQIEAFAAGGSRGGYSVLKSSAALSRLNEELKKHPTLHAYVKRALRKGLGLSKY